MEPATAALLGAAVASAVGLAAQYLGHRLGIERDRRNARRERLYDAVETAGAALFRRDAERPDEARPDSDSGPELDALADSISKGIVALSLYFREGHWVIEEYLAAGTRVLDAFRALHDHLGQPPDLREGFEEILGKLREAKKGSDRWMQRALREAGRV
jgi:hypothetical protein